MVYQTPYPRHIGSPTHGISNPLSMVFWTLINSILIPTHRILNPLSMVYRTRLSMVYRIEPPPHSSLTPLLNQTLYPWYFDLPTHGILTPYSWYIVYIEPPTHSILSPLPMASWRSTHGISESLSMVFWPSTQSISNTLFMVYWTPYAWYFDPSTYCISDH